METGFKCVYICTVVFDGIIISELKLLVFEINSAPYSTLFRLHQAYASTGKLKRNRSEKLHRSVYVVRLSLRLQQHHTNHCIFFEEDFFFNPKIVDTSNKNTPAAAAKRHLAHNIC